MFPAFEQDARRHLPEGALLDDHSIQSDHLADWRNRWCDVMSAYSHIVSKRDVFVTLNTRDFQRNEAALVALGIGKILTPDETVALLGHL
jgi:hypothetical protein